MDNARRTKRGTLSLLGSIVYRVLRICRSAICLFVLSAVIELEPYVRPFLRRLAILGACLCVYFEHIAQLPDFPFWSAMELSILCTGLLVLLSFLKSSPQR
jgi:hypothetical protein